MRAAVESGGCPRAGRGFLKGYEARQGVTVRVRSGHRKPEFDGMQGVIQRCFGDPDYPAVDVELEDGRYELFWFHQVDRVDGSAEA